MNVLVDVAKFLCDYTFNVRNIRENIKTIAQKHAMRGSGALIVHIVNDFLIKELPLVKERIKQSSSSSDDIKMMDGLKFGWELEPEKYLNYQNVTLIEYDDDNEYFNIDPDKDVRFTGRTNARYWEELESLQSEDQGLGVLSKGQIRDFYRYTLGMGRLRPDKKDDYDDIKDFLVDLFRIGANPVSFDSGEIKNPLDDIFNVTEEEYGYTKEERIQTQNNQELRKNQEEQFLEYCGNEDIIGD